ncbi:L-ascorbate peroxidase T [Nymphaea thermarum]|nr:L-ascorbate peroxidase T [Nymphaea thermarum]
MAGMRLPAARFAAPFLPTSTNRTMFPSYFRLHPLRFLQEPSPSLSVPLSSSPLFSEIVGRRAVHSASGVSTGCFSSDPDQLRKAKEGIKELLKNTFCHPILVRLGWHDAGTYNKNIEEWPLRGGANGSLRFEIELKHGANAGLLNALKLLQPIKDKYSSVTYADLFQLASATAIEEAGGPKIPMKYGRVDVTGPEQCPEEGRLPDAGPPSPAEHLREVFYRMGLNDKEIVALSGAHTLGRSRPERSGWGKPQTKYTEVKEKINEDLLVLPTDAVLFEDPGFKEYAEKYAEDQDAFSKDYAEAHAKLSNLGAKFDPPEGFSL